MSQEKRFLSYWGPCDSSSSSSFSNQSSSSFSNQSSSSSSSNQSSIISTQLRDMEDPAEHSVEYEKCSVFHCANYKCNLVLGDSLGACGEVKNLKSIIFLKISKDVRVRRKLDMSKDGPLKFCTYKSLECSSCHRSVGFVLCSTPHHLSSLRGLFLLLKDAINCYMLKSCIVINASRLSFEHRLLGRKLNEMKQELEAQLKHVELLREMLDDCRLQTADSTVTN